MKDYKTMSKEEILDYYYSIEPNTYEEICLSEDILLYMENVMGISEDEVCNYSLTR